MDVYGRPDDWAENAAERVHRQVQENLKRGVRVMEPDREPDYEQMYEDRMAHGGLDTAAQERQYEKFLDRPWGDAS